MKPERRGLGRGLSALMADVTDVANDKDAKTSAPRAAEQQIPIERVVANPDQPRRTFTEAALEDLASSIREKGIIQPLILRPHPTKPDTYEIVAGERRWRAAQRAQLHEVPAIVRELDDTEVLELAIIENIQRADLNAIEEAVGYRQLMERFGHTQEQVATALGKSRSHIANLLRLLTLPEDVQDHLREGRLSAGHARALVTAPNAAIIAAAIVAKGLSVRQVERLVKQPLKAANTPTPDVRDADTKALEKDLSAALSMKVIIDHRDGSEAGTLTVRYKSLEDLDEICRRLSVTIGAGEV